MTSQEILEKYFKFFEERGHKKIPNVSLVPENDPSLLFVNSGMFPLVPFLSGEKHPLGNRLINVQRCIRMDDLDEIGDHIHTLAFHMIGNWSLGDYSKEDQLPWAYEFFVDHLGLDPKRIYASAFSGDVDSPKDEKSVEILKMIYKKYGVDAKEKDRIWLYDEEHNWWQRGDAVGELGGPSSEIFYYLGDGDPSGKSPADNDTEFVELGNSVFMEYKKTEKGWKKLPQANIDFGGGLERITMAVQGKNDIFLTDDFYPIIQKIIELSGRHYSGRDILRMRNLADHVRGSVFMAMDGVTPGNKEENYVLRRLLRRMVRFGKKLGIEKDISTSLVPIVVDIFAWLYPDLKSKEEKIKEIFAAEETKFREVLNKTELKVEKLLSSFNGTVVNLATISFDLYQSYGFPREMFVDIAEEKGLIKDRTEFEKAYARSQSVHQNQSRAGAEGKFKGGLADQDENTIKYHTATHILLCALRKLFGEDVVQKGSNITGERLRFDFSFDKKLRKEEILALENEVNSIVDRGLPVQFEVMSREEAEETCAVGVFEDKYGDQVKVYFVGDGLDFAVSKELCGGPHVKNTSEIGHIEIYKQDKIGEGKLRLYARSKTS
ncbi:alanine--tRNA ligase [Patescibacteria group bacterium]